MTPLPPSRTIGLALVLVAGCGAVDDPTPDGTALITWDRSTATQGDSDDPTKAGPPHEIAAAKLVEGPSTKSFVVTAKDVEGKAFSFEITVDSSKVSIPKMDGAVEYWATTKVDAKLIGNEAFRIEGSCDDRVAWVLGAPGEVANTMMDCRVTGKRPNTLGDEDAITLGVWLQLEGSGKVMNSDPSVTVEEKKP